MRSTWHFGQENAVLMKPSSISPLQKVDDISPLIINIQIFLSTVIRHRLAEISMKTQVFIPRDYLQVSNFRESTGRNIRSKFTTVRLS